MTAAKPPFWQAFADHEKLLREKQAEQAEADRAAAAEDPTNRSLQIMAGRAFLRWRR